MFVNEGNYENKPLTKKGIKKRLVIVLFGNITNSNIYLSFLWFYQTFISLNRYFLGIYI